jgi:Icc-related predicted phosphoesterase
MEHPPIHLDGTAVEKVESVKFLGVNITNKLKWSTYTECDEEGTTAPLQLQEAEKMCLVTENPQ